MDSAAAAIDAAAVLVSLADFAAAVYDDVVWAVATAGSEPFALPVANDFAAVKNLFFSPLLCQNVNTLGYFAVTG